MHTEWPDQWKELYTIMLEKDTEGTEGVGYLPMTSL